MVSFVLDFGFTLRKYQGTSAFFLRLRGSPCECGAEVTFDSVSALLSFLSLSLVSGGQREALRDAETLEAIVPQTRRGFE